MKKTKKIFFVGILLAASVFLFRETIVSFALEIAVQKGSGEKIAYTKRHWEKGKLIYEGVSLGHSFYAEKAEIDFSVHRAPWYFEGHVVLAGPKFCLDSHAAQSRFLLTALIPSKFFVLKCDVEQGEVALEDGPPIFSVTFVSGAERDEIGTLVLYDASAPLNDPVFYGELAKKNEKICLDWNVAQAPLKFSRFFTQQWDEVEGVADGRGKCELDKDLAVSFAAIEGSVQSAVLVNRELGLQLECDTCQFEAAYPAREGAASIHGGKLLAFEPLVSEPWGVADLEGALKFERGKEPEYSLLGKLLFRDKNYPIAAQGKGNLHDDGSFWLENRVQMAAQENQPTIFSLSLCRSAAESYVVQADIEHMGPEAVATVLKGASSFFPEAKDLTVLQGAVKGSVAAWWESGSLKRVQWNQLALSHMELAHEPSGAKASCREAATSGEVENAAVSTLSLEVKQGNFQWNEWHASDLAASVAMADNVFKNSSLTGAVRGIPGEICLTGVWPEWEAAFRFAAPPSDWLKMKFAEESGSLLKLEANCKRGAEGFAATGSFFYGSDELTFGAEFEPTGSIRSGWFDASSIDLSAYGSWLRHLDPALKIEGRLSLKGEITPESIQGKGSAAAFKASSLKGEIEAKGQTDVAFDYGYRNDRFDGKAVLNEAGFRENSYGLVFEQMSGELFYSDGKLHVEKWTAQCEGIEISGQIDLCGRDLKISTESIGGSVEDLAKLCAHFPENLLKDMPSSGVFLSGNDGFQFFQSMDKPEWRFKARFEEVELPLSASAVLKDLTFDFEFDSSAKAGAISDCVGELNLNANNNYRFSAPYIRYRENGYQFDLQLQNGEKEILKLIGSGQERGDKLLLSLDHEKNHFFSSYWDRCSVGFLGKQMVSFEVFSHLQGSDLYPQALFLADAGFISCDTAYFEPLKKLAGPIAAKLSLPSPEQFFFEAEGINLTYDGDAVKKFSLKGKRVDGQWIFEKISADDLSFKGSLSQGICPYWEARWKDIVVKGDAALKDDLFLRIGAIEGVLPANFHIKGLKTARLSFSPQLKLHNIDIGAFQNEADVGRLNADAFVYDPEAKKWTAEKVAFRAAIGEGKESLAGFFAVSWSPRFFSFQGAVEQGAALWNKMAIKPSQVMGFYEEPWLNLKCQASFEKAPLHIQAKVNPSKGYQGALTIQDEKKEQSLAVSLREHFFCDSIAGSLCGLELHLKRNRPSDPFTGEAVIRDGNAAALLLPENFSFLKQIKNIELIGAWNNFAFQGELRGTGVQLKDYLFEEMHAAVQFDAVRATLKNLTLADVSGTCSIKQMECRKEKNWAIDAPLIKVQNFKPSKIRKAGIEPKETRPLVIRNLVFTDVHAEVSDKVTFSGRGSLNFTNAFKKEASLFEAPITILKNLGLDLELFTPASGEVECVLKGNKMFLSNLKNSFSEGKRSQFYFADDLEPSFIDFDGNLHINVRMKQDVVLKIVEPFALTIRGTWDKPAYGLR
jgi:hypothetical protein